MPSQPPSDSNPENVAAGGEPQARPASADLPSTSDGVPNEIELEFEALVSSSETIKFSLTPHYLQTVPTKKGRTPKLGPKCSHKENDTFQVLKIRQADKEDSEGETTVGRSRMQQSLEDFLRTTGPEDFSLNGSVKGASTAKWTDSSTSASAAVNSGPAGPSFFSSSHDVELDLSERTQQSQRTKHVMSELFRFAIRKRANRRGSASLLRTSSLQSQYLETPSVSRRQTFGSPQQKKRNDAILSTVNAFGTLPQRAPASQSHRASISSSLVNAEQAAITFPPGGLATESSNITGTPENVAPGDIPGALSDLAMESSAHQPNDEYSEMESFNIAGTPGKVAPSDVPGALSDLAMEMSALQSNDEVLEMESANIGGTPGKFAAAGNVPGALLDLKMGSSAYQPNHEAFKIESTSIAETPGMVSINGGLGVLSDLAMESSAHQPNDEASEMESFNIDGTPGKVAPSDVPGGLSDLAMEMSAHQSNYEVLEMESATASGMPGKLAASNVPGALPDLTMESSAHQSNDGGFKIESTSIAATPGMVAFNGGPGAHLGLAMESSVHQSNEGILPEASGMGGVQTSRPEMTSLPMTAPILSSASNDVQTPHPKESPLPTTQSMFPSESGDVQTLQNLESPLPKTLPTFPSISVDVQRPHLNKAPLWIPTKFPSRSEILHALQAEETPVPRLPSTVVSKSDVTETSASREIELPVTSPLERSTSLRHRDVKSTAAATSNIEPQSDVVQTSTSCKTEVPVASSLKRSTILIHRDAEPAAATTSNLQTSDSYETEVPVAPTLKRSTSLKHRDAEPAPSATSNVVQQIDDVQASVSRETEVPIASSLKQNTSLRLGHVEPATAATSNVEPCSGTTKWNVRRSLKSPSTPYRRQLLMSGDLPRRYSSLDTNKETRLADSVGPKTPVRRIDDKKLESPLTTSSPGHVTDAADREAATEYATSPGVVPREEPEKKDSTSVPEKKESMVVPEMIVGSVSSITTSILAPIEMDWRISIPYLKDELNRNNALDAKSTSPRTASHSPTTVNGPEVGLVPRGHEPMEGEPRTDRNVDKVKTMLPTSGTPSVAPKPDEVSLAGAGAAVLEEIVRERRKVVSGSGDMFPQTGASPLDDVVVRTCKRLMEENAHLKKQLVEVMKEHELDRQHFERLSLIAYRKLKELMTEKVTLEAEVSYLQLTLKNRAP